MIKISDLSKTYYDNNKEIKILNNINLIINKNIFYTIVGSSGCGKSTLLNIISGLDKNYNGNIYYNNNLTIGYMFQKDLLLPWLTIKDNCSLGLKLQNKKDDELVLYYLKKYNLLDYKDKYPNELSGGMRQRISLIRTLILKPDILLLDEPFSQLDYITKLKIEDDIYNIIKEEKITTIMVTHDISEAISLADKVIVLTNKPATIKYIYDIKLINKTNPKDNRYDPNFKYYFDKIWNDLNE